tara:strand:+ start:583 stop:735 length:153 start_codon:yes stop_codon:yes gene_type:complete
MKHKVKNVPILEIEMLSGKAGEAEQKEGNTWQNNGFAGARSLLICRDCEI